MLSQTKTRLLVKYFDQAIQGQVQSPVAAAGRIGISRPEYEEFLLQKLFFKNGGVYFKVFKNPTELHGEVSRCLAEKVIVQDEAGLLALSVKGQSYLNPIRGLIQFGSFFTLALLAAILGFAGGAGINYLLSNSFNSGVAPSLTYHPARALSQPINNSERFSKITFPAPSLLVITNDSKDHFKIELPPSTKNSLNFQGEISFYEEAPSYQRGIIKNEVELSSETALNGQTIRVFQSGDVGGGTRSYVVPLTFEDGQRSIFEIALFTYEPPMINESSSLTPAERLSAHQALEQAGLELARSVVVKSNTAKGEF